MPKKKVEEKKSFDKSKIIIIAAPLIIIACIIFSVKTIMNNKNTKEEPFKLDGLDAVDNAELLKDIMASDLKITDQSIINTDGISTYYATITNTKNSDYHVNYLYAVFTIDGKEINSLVSYDTTLKANEERLINISFDRDISKTTKIEYKVTENEIEEVDN